MVSLFGPPISKKSMLGHLVQQQAPDVWITGENALYCLEILQQLPGRFNIHLGKLMRTALHQGYGKLLIFSTESLPLRQVPARHYVPYIRIVWGKFQCCMDSAPAADKIPLLQSCPCQGCLQTAIGRMAEHRLAIGGCC